MLRFFIVIFIITAIPVCVLASDGKPICNIKFSQMIISTIKMDTLPSTKKNTENTNDKPASDIIKEVPKARRQPVPIPVNVKIRPIKIIKPKIIKPLIKVLH